MDKSRVTVQPMAAATAHGLPGPPPFCRVTSKDRYREPGSGGDYRVRCPLTPGKPAGPRKAFCGVFSRKGRLFPSRGSVIVGLTLRATLV